MIRGILKLVSPSGNSVSVLLKLQSEKITEDFALYPSFWVRLKVNSQRVLHVSLQWPEIFRMVNQSGLQLVIPFNVCS
jgi:hypothetical protein